MNNFNYIVLLNKNFNIIYKRIFIKQCIFGEKFKCVDLNQLINLDDGYIPTVIKEVLTYSRKYSTCFIEINNGGGSGFFVELPIPSEENPMSGLMTNNHVLDSKCIQPGNTISIRLNEYKKEFVLNEKDFIFTSELIDVTFIQLSNEIIDDIILNCPIHFLYPRFDNHKKGNLIYILQYPNKEFSYAKGRIQSITGFNYFHTASTERGSSGSPLLDREMGIIGIHKAGSESKKLNIATNINVIIYAIRLLYNKRYINDLNKAREPTKVLSEDETKLLKKKWFKTSKIKGNGIS